MSRLQHEDPAIQAALRQLHTERCKEWRARNPEASRAASKRWREKKRKDYLLALKLWRYFNREHIRAYNKAWRAANPDYQRKRRAAKASAKRAQGVAL